MSEFEDKNHDEPASAVALSASEAGWRPSRYNLVAPIPGDERGRVAVLNLLRNSCRAYAPLELAAMGMLDELPAGHPAVERLAQRGLVVNFDEHAAYELMSRAGAAGTRRIDITICPTMGCNFDCPYCFEDHTPGRMAAEVQDDVVALAERMLEASGAKLLHVAWYGGEPLLIPDIIESLSERLMALAEERGVAYGAHIITNGYLLTEDVAAMLGRARVEYAQITLDGVGAAHDATRHLAGGGPTYERIVENISRPGLPFDVLLRQNVHERNLDQVKTVRDLCESIHAASGNRIRHAAQLLFENDRSAGRCDSVAAIEGDGAADVLLDMGRLPTGCRPYPCGAGNLWEMAVDPQGRLYKCWEVVDKPRFSFGTARDWDPTDPIYTAREPDKLTCYLNQAAPQNHVECAECLWLPLCAGGCPHQRILGNGHMCLPYKDRPGEYALARLRLEQGSDADSTDGA